MPDTRLTDESLRGLLDAFPGSLLAFGEAYHDAVLELLETRATLSAIEYLCRHQRQAGGEIDPPLSGDMLAYRVLQLLGVEKVAIEPTAKGT